MSRCSLVQPRGVDRGGILPVLGGLVDKGTFRLFMTELLLGFCHRPDLGRALAKERSQGLSRFALVGLFRAVGPHINLSCVRRT